MGAADAPDDNDAKRATAEITRTEVNPVAPLPLPRYSSPTAASASSESSYAELPDLPPPTQKDLTLVGGNAPPLPPKPRRWALLLPLSVLLVTLVGAGGVVYWRLSALEKSSKLHVPESTPNVVAIAQHQAQLSFDSGVQLYNAKKYQAAIQAFEEALSYDPQLSEAHRSLGIAYAITHNQAKAIEHYRFYLEKQAQAADAPAVQKIIRDYERAQQPTPAPNLLPKRSKKASERFKTRQQRGAWRR